MDQQGAPGVLIHRNQSLKFRENVQMNKLLTGTIRLVHELNGNLLKIPMHQMICNLEYFHWMYSIDEVIHKNSLFKWNIVHFEDSRVNLFFFFFFEIHLISSIFTYKINLPHHIISSFPFSPSSFALFYLFISMPIELLLGSIFNGIASLNKPI